MPVVSFHAELGCRKKFKPFSITSLHFHDVGDDMNGARVSSVQDERTTCHLFGATVMAVLFEAESIHRKDTCVVGNRFGPLRQHLGDAISQHAPLTEAEIKCMCNRKRENVAWSVDQDCTITFNCESLIAFEPSTCRGRVTTCGVVYVRTVCFNGGYARNKLRSRGIVVATYDYCRTQAMGENELRIISKHAVDLDGGISAARKH